MYVYQNDITLCVKDLNAYTQIIFSPKLELSTDNKIIASLVLYKIKIIVYHISVVDHLSERRKS